MRRRDVAVLCLLWGALLAGLMWALSTQSRWVRENKPIEIRPPKPDASEPAPAGGSGVIGNVSEDTLTAMAKGLDAKASGKPKTKAEADPKRPSPK